MRFTSTINNIKAIEWALTIQQSYLFSWFYELPSWADKVIIEGEIYYFASKNKAVEELPLLTNKVDTMYRYYKQIEDHKLIKLKKIDGKDYISLTNKGKSWNLHKSDNSEENPTIFGKQSENISEENPTYNNTSINNNIKDKIDFNKLIAYFNKVFNKSARVINKTDRASFNKRISEGYTKEDIVKVIDNCSRDNNHKDNDYIYVTFEFLSRPKIFQRYAAMKHIKPIKKDENAFYNP